MNEIDRLKNKLKQEREKNKELKNTIKDMKKEILSLMKFTEEKIKDIMYIGDKK